jgi:hypothetical protein
MADDKSTTITISWAKVGPAIGLLVFIGGLVSAMVNTMLTIASYRSRLETAEVQLREQSSATRAMQAELVALRAQQELLARLQGRLAALEEGQVPVEMPLERTPRFVRSNPVARTAAAAAAPE